MEVTSTEVQNNFGQYLKFSIYEDIIVTKNGKKVAVIRSYDRETKGDVIFENAETYNSGGYGMTYEEFIKFSEQSENRYEYIDGKVYLLSSPSFEHQAIIMEISNIMYQWFKGKKCRPLTAPFDVTLKRKDDEENINVVQPDMVVICDTENVTEKGRYMGVPSLVLEVLSESTRSKDMLKKLDLYANSGVNEYWIVNPFSREVYLYFFSEGGISEYRVFREKDVVQSVFFKGLEVSLEQIFEK